MIVTNYASVLSKQKTGSAGVAIYFPATYTAFQADPYHRGYIKNNTDHVVEFVAKEQSAIFLNSYYH